MDTKSPINNENVSNSPQYRKHLSAEERLRSNPRSLTGNSSTNAGNRPISNSSSNINKVNRPISNTGNVSSYFANRRPLPPSEGVQNASTKNLTGNTKNIGGNNSVSQNKGNSLRAEQYDNLRMSAEDKLKRSEKTLSHASGGMGGVGTKSPLSSMSKSSSKVERKKVGGVVLDLETIEDATKQKFETRGRRNNVIILILSLMLVTSIIYLAIAVIGYKNSKKPANCIYKVEGDAKAEWIVQGGSKTEFRISQGLSADTIYLLNSTLNIKTEETVIITIEVQVLLEDEPILIAGLQEANNNLIRVEHTNKFVYQGTITGGGKVLMFRGIDFSEAPGKLNSDNVEIKVIAVINKI